MTSLTTEYNENLSFLPPAGEGRWWRVVPNPKSQAKPVALHLMESYRRGHKLMSRVLNAEATIATQEDLLEAGRLILLRAGDINKFLGDTFKEK